jgi:hypothetical protein
MRFLIYIAAILFIITSCNKARKCECIDTSQQAQQSGLDTITIYINGNKKDSKKACVNLADSLETCTLKDK